MGYPDILASKEQLEALVGEGNPYLKYRDDFEKICRRHNIKPRPIVESKFLFKALGADLDVFDLTAERGGEIIVDLNEPLEPGISGKDFSYDMVLDPGTLEHCFNIAQAAFNMAGLVKEGGYILHDNPVVAVNHGFYGMNPTWYFDFYNQNGFEVEEFGLHQKQAPYQASSTQRFLLPQFEHHIVVIARRTEIKPFTYPIQTKYRRPN